MSLGVTPNHHRYCAGKRPNLNWLVTNKWRNVAEIRRIRRLPMLLLASVHVRSAAQAAITTTTTITTTLSCA